VAGLCPNQAKAVLTALPQTYWLDLRSGAGTREGGMGKDRRE